MSSKTVRYKCPFCEKRLTREDLIGHIDDEHEDLLPQNYSSTRYVFNYVNKKPVDYSGKCTECGGPTFWREDVARYARQCDKPACKQSYLKKFEDNMVRMKGVARISSTPEGQEKMLANRKISGTYKFQNGKEKTYTGSYELNTLKFMDQVMNINPDDIMCPGPVLEYEYKGQRHFYISDFYYIPYNLIIEVKDGGKNPNRRNMPEYREKQIAKEKYIIKNTDYAYLRLTDNDLSQLLSVFMDLKMQLKDDTGKRTIHVNEAMNHFILESNDKSKLDKNFKKKETDIKFTYIDIKNNKSKVDKYLANDKDYKKTYKKSIDEINGEIVIDEDDELAGYVFVINNFITPLFVVKKYRGYGLGESLLKDAIKKYGAKRLWVYKDNEVAINLYKKYGFKVYIEDDEPSILMALDRKYAENLGYELTESVNEAMDALMTGYIPGFDSTGSVYIVNYMKNNVFSGDEERGYGVSNTPKLTNMFSRDKEGKLVKFPDNFLEECKYDVYMVKMSPEEVSNRIGNYIGEFVEEGFLYESIFGKKMYTYDQIMLEESAIPVIDFYKGLEMFSEVTRNLILQNTKLDDNPIYFNENSNMVFDIGNEKDLACISYTSLRDGKAYVESVEFPELRLEADSINSVEAKFLQLLSSYRKEVK